jgi:hypothetical protein
MTTHSHEREHAEAPELSGMLLLIAILVIAGALVWACT